MYKKSLVLFFSIALIFTGCQGIDKMPRPASEKINKQENVEAIQYKPVPNKGGGFTNKDLIYFIMTDRFRDGDQSNNSFIDVGKNNPRTYHGGDFKGIMEKLEYIKGLGATAIWLTPVAENTKGGYHGYWINDFYKVDPHLGSMEDLQQLVEKAHQLDIKVLLDHVVNHTSPNSKMLAEKPSDWFHPKKGISDWNDQNQLENNWLYDLPDFNVENPEVKSFLIDNALWWIDQTGIDGMRLDTVRHVPKTFWNDFAGAIKAKYPDFYLLGEVWNNNPRYLEQYHQLGIDGMTDYPLFEGIRSAFTRFGKTDALVSAIKQRDSYSTPEINGIFIDNHDNKRLITNAGGNGKESLKQALTFVMTYPSIPIIYYGTEIGMEGGDDPDNRRDMEWDAAKDSDILKFYRQLVKLRGSNLALQGGDINLLDYDSYFLSYMRMKDNKAVVVIMNLQGKEKNVTINIPSQAVSYSDVLTKKAYEVNAGKLDATLKPYDLIILESK